MKSNRFKVQKAYAGLASKAEAMRPKRVGSRQKALGRKPKAKPATYKRKSIKPGGEGQFANMRDAIVAKGASKDNAADIAAKAGRKKYGAKRFAKMAAVRRKRAGKGKG